LSGWHKLTLDEVAEIRRLAAARGGWRRAVFACWAVRRHGFNHPRDRVAAQLAPARRGYLAELTNRLAHLTKLLSRANERRTSAPLAGRLDLDRGARPARAARRRAARL